MIVNQNDRRCILGDCFTKHFARMYERRVEQAARYGYVALEPVLRIQDGHVEFLDWKILELLAEDLVHIARPADGYAVLAFLRRHSPAELECRVNRNSTCGSYTFERGKSRDGLRRQSPQRSVRAGKYVVPDPDRRVALGSAAEENSE